MANPLPNETEIYEKIEKEHIKVHHLVWELMDHYIGNDMHIIQLIAGNYVFGSSPEAIPPEYGKKILNQCDELRKFLVKLKNATREIPKKD